MSTDTPTGLPHWETIPDDIPAATREIKRALRARIEASGRSVADVFSEVEEGVRAEVADLALLAASKVVGETMSSERERRLVDDFLRGSGVGGSNN